jgi:hypothetical protein
MANTPKVLFRGAATTTLTTTLYTTPSATTTIVTNVVVTNTSATSKTFTLSLDGVKFADAVTIYANSLVTFDVKQVLVATDTIQGGASTTDVTFHICGMEIA